NKGAPPKDAAALFRSLILMAFTGETSIPRWVETLKSDPFYAILSGFLPACFSTYKVDGIFADSLPGVGTFYDFMDRLIRMDRILYKSKLRKHKRKPRKKQKKNKKYDSSKPGVVERVVNRVLKYDQAKLPHQLETTLNNILKDLFVMPSLSTGLLGDPDKFNIAGDGTCMPTNASPYGKKVCGCELKRGQSCNCPRHFSDPTATWGWDSFNEQYFYGHTFHGFTACDSFYSLPIHIKCVTGERHDSVTGVYELKELIESYPEINFYSAAFDSAYDASSFYLLNLHYGVNPIIDLNSRSSSPDSVNDFVKFDDNGLPLCKILSRKLRNWGIMRDSYRRKWLFPVQCDGCDKCPATSNKTFYTKTHDNPRFFTPILRGSEEWKQHYK
ncbi:MAG: transposase, partial [Bacillus sp. (in: firmicutes)]